MRERQRASDCVCERERKGERQRASDCVCERESETEIDRER